MVESPEIRRARSTNPDLIECPNCLSLNIITYGLQDVDNPGIVVYFGECRDCQHTWNLDNQN